MNVRETLSVLKYADKITLMHGDHTIEFYRNDELAVKAFGKYIVSAVMEVDGDRHNYIIELEIRPVVDER